ncbi:MAG: ATP-binding cassette domain-containing protein [Spirochaetes bacterium]|nr:ATP-binding cassette domain-containing protein [Spirochaetota bacterium]
MKHEAFISIKHLTFSYGAEEVISLKNLTLADSGITVLLGPNGSGKTTLLKILSGLLKPSNGILMLYGKPVENGTRKLLRKMSIFVHQNPYIFSGSVKHNIDYGLKLKKLPVKNRNRIISQVLNEVGLSGFEHRNAVRLSGGEKHRIAMARALAMEPDILMLDEPAAHMDSGSREAVENTLERLSGEGKGLIVSTHNLAFACRIADRIIRLEKGRLAETKVNLFKGRVSERDDYFCYFKTERITILCPPDRGNYTSAVLPYDDVILSSEEINASTQNQLRGTVSGIRKTSNLFLVTVNCGIPVKALVTERSIETIKIVPGRELFVSFKASAVKLY